ncbi:MAG: type II toxin-antitoxin system VapC family toxin [Planctomycetes bacterium]|nr:type II toxin-antitoxin system VapC family toxin [Planctomycetota bacterium]
MFLDTSGLFAFFVRDEPRHSQASSFLHGADALVTTNYVLAELHALMLARRIPPQTASTFLVRIQDHQFLDLIWTDSTVHKHGMELLLARPDKDYSLCDAVSFVVMRQYGETQALTTDRHFEQEGFVRLLNA